jgi:hypothetical protein
MPKNRGRKPGSGRMSRAAVGRHMETRKETIAHLDAMPSRSPKSERAAQVLSPMPQSRGSGMPSSMDTVSQRDKANKTAAKSDFRARHDRKQQGLSAGPVDFVHTSRTKRPLAPDQVRTLKSSGRIDPFSVHTLQDTASEHFSDGRSVMGTAMELKGRKARKTAPPGKEKLPPIQVLREGDKVFTLDHRRVAAARRANTALDYTLNEGNKASKDATRKRSTTTGGSVLKLTASQQVPYTLKDLFGSDD